MLSVTNLGAGCLLVSALALPPAHVEGEGARTIRYESGAHLEFDSMSSTFAGQEVPAEYLPAMEIDVDVATVLALRDQPGAGETWTRTYEEYEHEETAAVRIYEEDEFTTRRWASPLVERSVAFACDEEGCTADWPSGERGEDRWLEDLPAHADLRALLGDAGSANEASTADEWTVGTRAALALLRPAAGLPVELEEGEPDGYGPEEWTGELRVRSAGPREIDGRRCDVFTFRGTCTSTSEREVELTFVPVSDGFADEVAERTYVVEGELCRDAATGALRSAEARADVTTTTTIDRRDDQPGADFTSTVVLKGTWELVVDVDDEG